MTSFTDNFRKTPTSTTSGKFPSTCSKESFDADLRSVFFFRALSKFEKCSSGNNFFYNSKLDGVFFGHPDGVAWNCNYVIQKAERALMAAALNYETVHKYGSDDL